MAKAPPNYGRSTSNPPHLAASYWTNLRDGDIVVAYVSFSPLFANLLSMALVTDRRAVGQCVL